MKKFLIMALIVNLYGCNDGFEECDNKQFSFPKEITSIKGRYFDNNGLLHERYFISKYNACLNGYVYEKTLYNCEKSYAVDKPLFMLSSDVYCDGTEFNVPLGEYIRLTDDVENIKL